MGRLAFLALALILSGPASAQVKQSGQVTAGHVTKWVTNGVVGDGGTAASGSLTSLGVTAGGPGICQNSDLITAPGYQQACIGVTTAGGGFISVQNFGSASALPFQLITNGVSSTFVTAIAPFVDGQVVCFSGTSGSIAGCSPNSITNGFLAKTPAATLKGNPTTSLATVTDFTLASLPSNVAPGANTDFLLLWNASTGALNKVTPGAIASAATAGVSSLGGLTGALTLGNGLTASGSNIGLVREVLLAPRTYYVRTDGNDSNNCLANSSGGACLTPQHALNLALGIDLNGQAVTIQIVDGSYSGNILMQYQQVGAGTITVHGNTGTPSNVVLSAPSGDSLTVTNGAVLSVTGVTFASAAGYCVRSENGAQLTLSVFQTNTCAIIGIEAGNLATVTIQTGYTINGGGAGHVHFINGGYVLYSGTGTATLTGTPAFSAFFAGGSINGNLQFGIWTFSGPATGSRFFVHSGAVLITPAGTGDLNFLPGNTAGVLEDSGQYNDFVGSITWPSFVSTVTSLTGSLSSANGAVTYDRVHGNSYAIQAQANIVTNGTGSGAINMAMPITAATNSYFGGRSSLTGRQLTGIMLAGSSTLTISLFDNGYPGASGEALVLGATVQSQ